MAADRVLKLALIGTVAGLYSGLFGVGGGSVIVPLLVLWLGFDHRMATGTSLAAIARHRPVRRAAPGRLRQRRPRQGGARRAAGPARACVAGTAIQQRLREQVVMLLFAGLLVVVAVDLVLS